MTTADLEAYCARIAYTGPLTPNLEVLKAIHESHATAIPFENIDVLLGRPIRLDPESLLRKIVHDRRGGYCFEHNLLLAAALRTIGFVVTPLLARVRWQVPAGIHTPQTHMALQVTLDGRTWLADGGFGGMGLVAPIALDSSDVQHSHHEPRRLISHGRNLLQQVRLGGVWTDVYVLHLDEAYPIDFEVANWYTSTHQQSRFRQNLMVARASADRRLAVLNRELTVRRLDGSSEKHPIASPDELARVLESKFGLQLPAAAFLSCPGLDWEKPPASTVAR